MFKKVATRAIVYFFTLFLPSPSLWSCEYVAHAGGGISGKTYTNSIEAISSSHDGGFYLIEVDFSPSADGDWFCLHDLSEINIDDVDAWLSKSVDRYS